MSATGISAAFTRVAVSRVSFVHARPDMGHRRWARWAGSARQGRGGAAERSRSSTQEPERECGAHLVSELEVRVVVLVERRRDGCHGGGAGVDHRGDAAHQRRVRSVRGDYRLLRAVWVASVTGGSGGAAALCRVLACVAVLGLRGGDHVVGGGGGGASWRRCVLVVFETRVRRATGPLHRAQAGRAPVPDLLG